MTISLHKNLQIWHNPFEQLVWCKVFWSYFFSAELRSSQYLLLRWYSLLTRPRRYARALHITRYNYLCSLRYFLLLHRKVSYQARFGAVCRGKSPVFFIGFIPGGTEFFLRYTGFFRDLPNEKIWQIRRKIPVLSLFMFSQRCRRDRVPYIYSSATAASVSRIPHVLISCWQVWTVWCATITWKSPCNRRSKSLCNNSWAALERDTRSKNIDGQHTDKSGERASLSQPGGGWGSECGGVV